MKRLIWLLPVSLVLLVASCLKDEMNETIVLVGTESNVQPIDSIISDTLLNYIGDSTVMNNEVLVLPEGNMPPDIQGEFVFGPRKLFRYNITQSIEDGDTLYIRLEEQHNMMVRCDLKESSLPQASVDAYVMGTDTCFTVYFTVTYKDLENQDGTGEKYSLEKGYVITGKITDAGIEQAWMACVNIKSSIADLVDQIFVYHVKTNDAANPFGTAIRQKWYPKN